MLGNRQFATPQFRVGNRSSLLHKSRESEFPPTKIVTALLMYFALFLMGFALFSQKTAIFCNFKLTMGVK